MSVMDCKWTVGGGGPPIYPPFGITTGGVIPIRLYNMGTTTLSGAGLFLVPATSLGDLNYPSEHPPETDLQDLLTWGSRVDAGLELTGGLCIEYQSVDDDDLPILITDRFSRTKGADMSTRFMLPDIQPNGGGMDIDLWLETPPGEASRRFYVTLALN